MRLLAVLLVSLATGLLWGRRSLAVVTVSGPSMAPTYVDGQRVLVRRKPLARVRRGEVVLVERPGAETGWVGPPVRGPVADRPWLVKRAVAVAGDPFPPDLVGGRAGATHLGNRVPPHRLIVLGDNLAESYDSRRFGFVEPRRMYGVVLRPLLNRSRTWPTSS